MLILSLIAFPLFAGLVLLFIKGENAKKVALGASIIELGVAIAAFLQVRHNPASPELFFDREWIRSIGIHFNVALDGISMLMVLLTALLVPFIILSSFRREYENPSAFYSLILIMQMALVGVFSAMDGFLFYIFWELALIPIWFICLLWGGDDRARITFKFFVYTLVGSLFMLVGLIFVFLHTTNHSFEIRALYEAGKNLSSSEQTWIFWAM